MPSGPRVLIDDLPALPVARRNSTQHPLDTDAAAIVVLVLLVLLAFSPWWAGGRLFAPLDIVHELYEPWNAGDPQVDVHNHFTSDAVTQYLVYRRIAERSFAEDGFVGWSDLTFGGRPEHTNTMAAYDDWTMQLHRWFRFWTAWHLGLIGQFLAGALGMFLFLRSQRCSPLVGLLGAVAYAASSLLVLRIYHRWHLAGFAWVPWMAWAMYRSMAGRGWAWPLVPAFMALSFIGGNLQTNAFTALVIGSVWLGLLLRDATDRGTYVTVNVAIWTVLGIGLAAFSLLPEALAYVEGLALGGGRGGIGYEHGMMQPILSALLIPLQLLPSLLGSPTSLDLAKTLDVSLMDIAYFGFVPGIIAYRAAFLRSVPAAAKCLMTLGLVLPLTPLVGPLYHRVQLLFIFGGVWAFAMYWQHADGERIDPFLQRWFYAFAVFVGAWLIASLATVVFEAELTRMLEAEIGRRIDAGGAGAFGSSYPEWMLQRSRRLIVELRTWHPRQAAVVIAALGGFAAVLLRVRKGVRPASAVLLAALVLELGAFASSSVTVVDPAEHPPYPDDRDLSVVQARVGPHGRVVVVRDAEDALTFLPPNTLAMYGIPTIMGYESIVAPGIWEAADSSTDATALGRIGVSHAVSPPDARLPAGWTPVYRGDRLALWRNERALPRYMALRPVPTDSATPAWRRSREPVPSESRIAGTVTVKIATANRRVLHAPAGSAALRIAESWAEGWRFRVDGGPWQRVRQAADRSMLISIDPEASPTRVEMSYRSAARAAGWHITIVALLATLAAAGGLLVRRAKPPRSAGPARVRR
ncbi:MAG: hypothetical protein ACOC8B_03070 [Gemmatimonadota bacterium]